MKVLLVTHNPILTNHNMGKTLMSLFSGFEREELCQLYIYPSIPDADVCSSFYRITDKNVLKSYYKFRVDGKRIDAKQGKGAIFENPSDQKLYRHRNNHAPWKCIVRDAMWKHSRWYNGDLKDWLEEQGPTCIFVAPGRAKLLYDIALQLAQDLNIPIITYLCDDFYFTNPEQSLSGRLYQSLLKNKIEALISQTEQCITICDSMTERYSRRFHTPFQTVMTPSSRPAAHEIKKVEQPTSICYMGNIRSGRYNSLTEIGRALDDINAERGTEYCLKIYSEERNQKILSAFDGIKSVQLCGFVSGEEFERIFLSADILLHVESFDTADIDRVRYSVSTKIADSLASGICLFAYGPEEVASVHYMKEEQCAIVCTEQQKLKETLLTAFCSRECRESAARNALLTAVRNHNPEKNQRAVRELFLKIENTTQAVSGEVKF